MRDMLNRIPVRTDATVTRLIDGEAVVVEPRQGMVNVMNSVGSRVWELVDGRRSVGDIAGLICREYAADRDKILKDAQVFLDGLCEQGWIKYESLSSRNQQDL